MVWGGCAFLAFVFVVEKPGTHIYVIMLPLALLAGEGAAMLWDGLRADTKLGAVGVLVAAAAAVLIFSGYLFAAYLRQDVEYWQDWPASRLFFIGCRRSMPIPTVSPSSAWCTAADGKQPANCCSRANDDCL